jgi:hypothetical protein
MTYIKIEVDELELEVSQWPVFLLPPGKTVPRAFKIKDGSWKVFFGTSSYTWVSNTDSVNVRTAVDKEPEPDVCHVPNVGFSEGFILRALAIAQDPKLAKELV